jgi:hypothetical protein
MYPRCAGASFLELVGIAGCSRVLASQRVIVELLHTRRVARDGTWGSGFGGSAPVRSCAALRHRPPLGGWPPLGTRPALGGWPPLGTRPTLGDGSPLLRRSALGRSPSFWSRSFFPVGSRFGSASLTFRHILPPAARALYQRNASRQDRIAAHARSPPGRCLKAL